MKTLLIVNPAAGHGLGRKTFARLETRLRTEIPGLEVRFSEHAGHSVDLGREAARGAYDRILCLGGDGTPYEVINGLYADGRPARLPEIGQIPAGTGNSFLRDFGIETPEQALEAIFAGRRRKADLVEFDSQESQPIANLGADEGRILSDAASEHQRVQHAQGPSKRTDPFPGLIADSRTARPLQRHGHRPSL